MEKRRKMRFLNDHPDQIARATRPNIWSPKNVAECLAMSQEVLVFLETKHIWRPNTWRPNIFGDQILGLVALAIDLKKELAAYENMPDAVKITEEDLLRDGFGSHPFFHCLIAEAKKEDETEDTGVVGFAMYYFTYDPWIGKLLYLEDFYVMDDFRGWGIGTELLKRLSQIALENSCSCMHFLVVVWNKPSIEYYMRRGASDLSTEEGWHLFRFDKEQLISMANGQ